MHIQENIENIGDSLSICFGNFMGLFFLILSVLVPALAMGEECAYFSEGDNLPHEFLGGFLDDRNDSIIEICSGEKYQLIWPAVVSREGVCVAFSREINPTSRELGNINIRMSVVNKNKGCPKIESGSYIPTNGISIGVFRNVIYSLISVINGDGGKFHPINNKSIVNLKIIRDEIGKCCNVEKSIVSIENSKNTPESDIFIRVILLLDRKVFSVGMDLLDGEMGVYKIDSIDVD